MITVFAALLGAAALQAAPVEAQPDRIEAGWLEGCWEGRGFGLPATECWMSAPSGRMTGMFQLLEEDGGQRFSEILIIDTFEDGPALRLKHFDAELKGWEEKDEFLSFPFVEQSENRLVFRGLEFRLEAEDRLVIDLSMRRGGEPHVERFEFVRAR
ncbi:MAG: DUF6265 family protein [Oceanicaulis sp.]